MKRLAKYMYNTLSCFIVMAVVIGACKKDEDNPEYVGTWYQIYTDGGLTFKQLLTLKKSSFEMLIQLQNPTNPGIYINYMGQKGTFTVQNDILTITLTSIGIAEINPVTFMPMGDIVYYNSGSAEFNNMLQQAGFNDLTFNAKYAVSGNELTFKIDINNNGSFDDDVDETGVFTRQ
jgi:hypothetical protein